jgi:heavy metal translocating P-type ATPase
MLPPSGSAGMVLVSEVRWAATSLIAFLLAGATLLRDGPGWLSGVLFALCYLAGGWEPTLEGLRALRERRLDVDLLMTVAALGAAAIGQVLDGGLLIVIFATSGALEAVLTARTEASVRRLLDITPERARRVLPTGDTMDVPAAEITAEDTVLVLPGERIPADGTIDEGESEVDESSLTGEPLPRRRTVDDRVLAGTLNGTGALRVRVATAAAESVLARVSDQVEEAVQTKAHRQLRIETVEQRYSTSVVVATLALIGLPLALGAGIEPTLLRAMTFMIVASPCAIVLATMPPLLAAVATAGRHGVLVKDARVVEALAGVDTVVTDKTGTLTEGSPRVEQVVALGLSTGKEVLALAAAVELGSEHPLAEAITTAARGQGLRVRAATAVRALPGRGVTGTVDGTTVAVLDPATLDAEPDEVAPQRAQGRTAVVVTVDDEAVGVLGISDAVRVDAATAVHRLAALTGRTPVLLTGDSAAAAAPVAAAVGITDVRAGLLPEDKTAAVAALQAGGRRVLALGDGVNDAPALATAEVGVAMGARGSALSIAAADVVVLRPELGGVPAVVELARRAQAVVTQNLVLAGTVIVALVTWDLLGTLPLPLGVAGHEASTVLVCLNGLRLLRRGAWPTTARSPGGDDRQHTAAARPTVQQR